jgi:hypothetical protein
MPYFMQQAFGSATCRSGSNICFEDVAASCSTGETLAGAGETLAGADFLALLSALATVARLESDSP